MGEETYKLIPSKGTRLQMMVVLEVLVTVSIVWATIFTAYHAKEITPELFLAFLAGWADFTKWNVGIYAVSETGVKVAESGMNK